MLIVLTLVPYPHHPSYSSYTLYIMSGSCNLYRDKRLIGSLLADVVDFKSRGDWGIQRVPSWIMQILYEDGMVSHALMQLKSNQFCSWTLLTKHLCITHFPNSPKGADISD